MSLTLRGEEFVMFTFVDVSYCRVVIHMLAQLSDKTPVIKVL